MSSQNYKVTTPRGSVDVNAGVDLYKSSFVSSGATTYIWRQNVQSLSDILKEDALPLVVKLNNENTVNDETPIDLQQPLLLYKEIKAKKLHARNLRAKDGIRGTRVVYQTVGPFVTFPESYVGYFRHLDEPDKPTLLVADVARFMPKAVISLDLCEGFICLSDIGESLYQKKAIPEGLYYPQNLLEEQITYVNSKKSERHKLVRCLMCHDTKGRNVLFPLDEKGRFYLGEPKSKTAKHLGNMHDKTNQAFKWPEFDLKELQGLRVKMVYGNKPSEECRFTGNLEFSHFTEEHTVVGVTMTSNPRMFEMAVTSEPFFIAALNSEDLDSSSLQQKSLKFAKTEFDNYSRCAKVKREYDIADQEDE